jgi:calcineurin-like phosphoesterase family protein
MVRGSKEKMIWFTSDTHFWHKNIIRLSKRPFDTLHQMHEHFIQEWNKRVQPNETVYVLGDFSFSNKTMTQPIISCLNGHKILILGNHDRHAKKMIEMGFDEVHENMYIEIGNKQKVYLSHYPFHPMNTFVRHKQGDDHKVAINWPYDKVDMRYMHKRIVDDGKMWLLHGHVHNAWLQNGRQINVGVDVWDYKPVPHEKILQLIEKGPKFDGKTDDDYGD